MSRPQFDRIQKGETGYRIHHHRHQTPVQDQIVEEGSGDMRTQDGRTTVHLQQEASGQWRLMLQSEAVPDADLFSNRLPRLWRQQGCALRTSRAQRQRHQRLQRLQRHCVEGEEADVEEEEYSEEGGRLTWGRRRDETGRRDEGRPPSLFVRSESIC